jgi:hypothetical protein
MFPLCGHRVYKGAEACQGLLITWWWASGERLVSLIDGFCRSRIVRENSSVNMRDDEGGSEQPGWRRAAAASLEATGRVRALVTDSESKEGL